MGSSAGKEGGGEGSLDRPARWLSKMMTSLLPERYCSTYLLAGAAKDSQHHTAVKPSEAACAQLCRAQGQAIPHRQRPVKLRAPQAVDQYQRWPASAGIAKPMVGEADAACRARKRAGRKGAGEG